MSITKPLQRVVRCVCTQCGSISDVTNDLAVGESPETDEQYSFRVLTVTTTIDGESLPAMPNFCPYCGHPPLAKKNYGAAARKLELSLAELGERLERAFAAGVSCVRDRANE